MSILLPPLVQATPPLLPGQLFPLGPSEVRTLCDGRDSGKGGPLPNLERWMGVHQVQQAGSFFLITFLDAFQKTQSPGVILIRRDGAGPSHMGRKGVYGRACVCLHRRKQMWVCIGGPVKRLLST